MARVDYFDLENTIKSILEADSSLSGVTITVEGEVPGGGVGLFPYVGIHIERRDPHGGQPLAAGQRTRLNLKFAIWCWEYSLESVAKAIQLRDDLVGKVEVALMKNRTINNKVACIWLDGGRLPSGKDPESNGWLSAGEIIVIADVTASTT